MPSCGTDEIRDFVDVLHLHKTYLSLGAMVWAACGKDPGCTPEFLLDHVSRHTAYTQADLNRLRLRVPIDLVTMKQSWLTASVAARQLLVTLPPEEIGCLYLDKSNNPVTPDTSSAGFSKLIRHVGCIRGA